MEREPITIIKTTIIIVLDMKCIKFVFYLQKGGGAIFYHIYKQFDLVLFSMEVKIHVKGILVFMYVTCQVKFWSMPLFTGFVTRLTLPVQLVEQALPTLPKHLITNQVFSRFRVT